MPESRYPREALAKGTHEAGQGNGHGDGRHSQWEKAGSSLGSIVAGGALAAYGMSRKSAGGTALAAAGGFLAFQGLRQAASPVVQHVERSCTINREVSDVFAFFRNFENLPKFMPHLKSVRPSGGRMWHWLARAPLGLELDWDVEILEEKENEFLAWRSLPGAVIPNRGAVEFRAASSYHGGTELTVAVDYAPHGGRGGALCARIFGNEPGRQLREDLRRLKQLLETGEIATTEGQSHGRRAAFVRMMQAVNESPIRNRRAKDEPWTIGNQWQAIG
jgi:uncharacterized membrane protein